MIPQQTTYPWEATHYVSMSCGRGIFVIGDPEKIEVGKPVIHNCDERKVDEHSTCVITRLKEFK